MTSRAFGRENLPSNVERHMWTEQDGREFALFGLQCLGIAGLAVLLYSAGPVLGLALVVGTLAVWSGVRRSTSAKPDGTSEQ